MRACIARAIVGRWLPNGEIAFLGRMDEQVKVRGYRVEPSEVSTVLSQHPAVQESLVIATDDAPGEKQLVAYLVLAVGVTVSATALREYLRQRVPDYMVPASFVAIPQLPVTEQGKVNRAGLPGVNGNRLSDEAYIAPRSLVEEELVKILRAAVEAGTRRRERQFLSAGRAFTAGHAGDRPGERNVWRRFDAA